MRRIRVGSISMGLSLIAFGVILLIFHGSSELAVQQIMKWWPVIIIILGVETLLHVYFTAIGKTECVKFDMFSVMMVGLIIMVTLGIYIATSIFENPRFNQGCIQNNSHTFQIK
ncbi:MAG: hypothetical protein ACM3KR_08640 [Deltaproteobacteria bacterium]